MLTSEDIPTIRNAIRWRLDGEPGAYVLEPTLVQPVKKGQWYEDIRTHLDVLAREDFIRVVVIVGMGMGIGASGPKEVHVRSEFHLPDPFEHGHLLNQIDEIAEGLKKARRGALESPQVSPELRDLPGTGPRGAWDRYGMLMGRHG